MKTVFTLLAAVALSGVALAQKMDPHMKMGGHTMAKGKTLMCPVMPSRKVDVAAATKAHNYADYKGNRYLFCCDDCPKMFKANPAKYAKGPHIKTPKGK